MNLTEYGRSKERCQNSFAGVGLFASASSGIDTLVRDTPAIFLALQWMANKSKYVSN